MEINTDYTGGLNAVPGIRADTVPEKPDQAQIAANLIGEAAVLLNGEEVLQANVNNTLADILKLMGFSASPENIKLMQTLIQNSFAANKENLVLLNQAAKLSGLEPEKAMFFLKNNIKVTPQNSDILKSFITNETAIVKQLDTLISAINNMPEEPLRAALFSILSGEKAESLGDAPENVTGGISHDASVTIRQASPATNNPSTPALITEQLMREFVSELTSMQDKNSFSKYVALSAENHPEMKDLVYETAEKAVIFVDEMIENGIAYTDHLIEAEVPDPESFSKPEGVAELDKNVINPGEDPATTEYDKQDIYIPQEETVEDIPVRRANAQYPDINDNTDIKAHITKKFNFDFKKSDVKDIDRLLNEIRTAVREVENELSSLNMRDHPVFKAAADIGKNLDFLNQMKDSIFIQLPVIINNERTNCDIFVFKDRNKKSAGKTGKSALIALDTVNMGRVESYVVKTVENAVSCQFRLDNKATEKLFMANMNKLENALKEKRLNLTSVSYMELEQPFSIIGDEPGSTVIAEYSEGLFDVKA